MGNKDIQHQQVTSKVITLRDIQVIIDRDVAKIYGVTTREVNQLLKNNPKKFPEGYVIELTEKEKSDVVISNDHLKRLKYSHAAVKAYTERGLYMLATIVRSEKQMVEFIHNFKYEYDDTYFHINEFEFI